MVERLATALNIAFLVLATVLFLIITARLSRGLRFKSFSFQITLALVLWTLTEIVWALQSAGILRPSSTYEELLLTILHTAAMLIVVFLVLSRSASFLRRGAHHG